jgi:hypothetical protein
VDDPAVADEKASLRDRNDIAKRGHPVLQGSPTAAHHPLAAIGRAAAHVDRHFAIRYQAFDSPREIRRVGGGLRSSETQSQFVCAGTAVLRRLSYDLLGGTGEREPRDEAVIEHSPGLLPRRRRSSAPTISGRAMPLSRTIVSRCAGQSLPLGHSAISIAPTASFAISLASALSGRAAQGRYCTMSRTTRAPPPRRSPAPMARVPTPSLPE